MGTSSGIVAAGELRGHLMLRSKFVALASIFLAAGCASNSGDDGSNTSASVVSPTTIETFTSDQNGFDTHSFWIDTGAEVVVFDAQFTEDYGRQLIAQIQSKTKTPIAWVVITHPNPDKFQGANAFRALGAKVIASRHTADAIPGVYAYKKAYFTEVAKTFTPETYPALPVIDETFERSFELPLRGSRSIQLRELGSPGVSATQTVAWIRDANALVVGDLVHHRAHAWLEGGIVDGAPHPDLEGWKRDLDELVTIAPGATVYGGRGEVAPLGEAVADEKAYLDGMKAIVTDEVKKLATPVETLAGSDANNVYTTIQARAVSAYPSYTLPYMIGFGVYGLAQQIAKEVAGE